MKATTASAAVLASLLPLAAAKECKPPVESEKLQELITEEGYVCTVQLNPVRVLT
jgi:hypothetical protein